MAGSTTPPLNKNNLHVIVLKLGVDILPPFLSIVVTPLLILLPAERLLRAEGNVAVKWEGAIGRNALRDKLNKKLLEYFSQYQSARWSNWQRPGTASWSKLMIPLLSKAGPEIRQLHICSLPCGFIETMDYVFLKHWCGMRIGNTNSGILKKNGTIQYKRHLRCEKHPFGLWVLITAKQTLLDLIRKILI